MRILAISQWWRPEPVPLVTQLIDGLAARGHEIEVLTGFPNYPTGELHEGYSLRFRKVEQDGPLRIVRVPLYPSHDASALKRSVNYLSFGLSSSMIGLASVRKPEVVYVYHPPVTAAWPARLLTQLRRVPFVLHVQDLWPDAIFESGMLPRSRSRAIQARLMSAQVQQSYHAASHIVVISQGFRDMLISRGIPGHKISVMLNVALAAGTQGASPEYRKRLGPTNRRVVLFAGNIGRFQNLDPIIREFSRLGDDSPLHLAIIGEGVEKLQLMDLVRSLQTDRVSIIDGVAHDEALKYQASADIHLVSLSSSEFLNLTIPSKLAVSLVMGKPLLVIASGETSTLVRQIGAGVTCNPSPNEISAALDRLSSMDESVLLQFGRAGRVFAASELDTHERLTKWESLLSRVLGESEK